MIGRGPWRQVRLRLGRHWFRLLRRVVLVPAGDEGSVVSRDRHPVQAACPGSPVEEDGCRHQRRRVDGNTVMRQYPLGTYTNWHGLVLGRCYLIGQSRG